MRPVPIAQPPIVWATNGVALHGKLAGARGPPKDTGTAPGHKKKTTPIPTNTAPAEATSPRAIVTADSVRWSVVVAVISLGIVPACRTDLSRTRNRRGHPVRRGPDAACRGWNLPFRPAPRTGTA